MPKERNVSVREVLLARRHLRAFTVAQKNRARRFIELRDQIEHMTNVLGLAKRTTIVLNGWPVEYWSLGVHRRISAKRPPDDFYMRRLISEEPYWRDRVDAANIFVRADDRDKPARKRRFRVGYRTATQTYNGDYYVPGDFTKAQAIRIAQLLVGHRMLPQTTGCHEKGITLYDLDEEYLEPFEC